MDRLKQAYGNWVEGDRFWDREKDVELLIEKIHDGAHILLTAQRRMGKTSLMREAKRRLEGRYICLFVDLQKASSAEDAIVALSLALKPHEGQWRKIKGMFANALGGAAERIEELNLGELGIKLRAGLVSGNWSEKGDMLFSTMAGSDPPVVLMMDEAPVMVNRILKGEDYRITPQRKSETDAFMSWLRKNSLEHQGQVRIVLSGSIGFEPILRQAGLSATINNFLPFDLGPWDEPTATGCLRALANQYGINFRDNAETEMVRMLGCCIPHHVQMFFTHVCDRCKRRGRMDISPDEVGEVYENQMLGVRGHTELTHYEDRLKLVLGPEILTFAIEMLTEAAVTGRLTSASLVAIQKGYEFTEISVREATEEILRVLEHDGYLKAQAEGYIFESRLLQDWWKKRYSSLYLPALQREI
ncbi:MAG: hypothetical protein P4L55_21975 [Syntrophobacteraceae bacterium]|nr:hypothetical protein [Syntrophobacteraceae bacterium]